MIVTPVRTESPSAIVAYPTVTPERSVIALCLPGRPSNGIPRSRARFFIWTPLQSAPGFLRYFPSLHQASRRAPVIERAYRSRWIINYECVFTYSFPAGTISALIQEKEKHMSKDIVENGQVVSIEYTLRVDGEVLDSSDQGGPLQFLAGYGNIIPGLENEMMGMKIGDSKDVVVSPEDG